MDFNNQYQFASNSQSGYNPFMSVAPLTPSHSQSAPSDEYSRSSPEVFDSIRAGEPFQPFDYQQGFQTQPQHGSGFSGPGGSGGPPTPPNHPSAFGQQRQHLHQHQHQHQHQHRQAPNAFGNGNVNGSFGHGSGVPMTGDLGLLNKPDEDDLSNERAGSDDENMTPAQTKRKAQNRAAQRAFRERKEKHVKDLEAKLADLRNAQEQASAENERLKRDLQKISTENEILKATSSSSSMGGRHSLPRYSEPPMVTGPMRFSPTDFASSILRGHQNKQFSHRIVKSSDGQNLFAAGAAWDYIVDHDLFKRGLVDITYVSEHLRTRAICDGQGPVFPEKDIIEAIQLGVAHGTDDLL